MTLFAPTVAQRVTYPVKLTTTNATTIASVADAKRVLTLESVLICADAGGSTIDLWVTDGSTSYYLIKGKTIAANTYELLTDHHVVLTDGWSLKAQAGTANKIDITAIALRANQLTA